MNPSGSIVTRVSDLKVHFPMRRSIFGFGPSPTIRAVDGVSLEIRQGEILGLVGESGCGKSSLGRAILRLVEPTSGKVEINGVDFLALRGQELRRARRNAQMVFQDPYASLDPRMSVLNILSEPLTAHENLSSKELLSRVTEALERVGLSPSQLNKYPHEFSGGQRQRIAIARALILRPKVIIADEPVSSLDVSVQAQVLNLLKDIQRELGLSLIFISHNLAVVKYISDRIAVMYLGKIVETASVADLYKNPQHPYTKALISAVPTPDPKVEKARVRTPLKGEPPSPVKPPSGCAFHTRCPIAVGKCSTDEPKLEPFGSQGWKVSCWEVKH